jgi:hypothetical protein
MDFDVAGAIEAAEPTSDEPLDRRGCRRNIADEVTFSVGRPSIAALWARISLRRPVFLSRPIGTLSWLRTGGSRRSGTTIRTWGL